MDLQNKETNVGGNKKNPSKIPQKPLFLKPFLQRDIIVGWLHEIQHSASYSIKEQDEEVAILQVFFFFFR